LQWGTPVGKSQSVPFRAKVSCRPTAEATRRNCLPNTEIKYHHHHPLNRGVGVSV
jgi:hypothetical protein